MNLTKPQELIWDMERFAGGSVSVICTSLLRKGEQNEETLKNIANKLFFYNDALRTRIVTDGTKVTQYFAEYKEQNIEVLRFFDSKGLENYAEGYSHSAMDLSGSLCEIKVIFLPGKYGLLVKIHHIIADAWTMALLATQFNLLIEGKLPQHHSYIEFCKNEAEYRNSKKFLKDKQFFWNLTEQRKESVSLCDQSVGNLLSERKIFVINEENAVKIRGFSNRMNCSVFSVFAAALTAYISRTNESKERFFIGTNVLNRSNVQEMNTAGMFVNTVPLLLSAKLKASFSENLESIEDMLLSVFRHQRYNYKELLADIQAEGQPYGRLFDVTLNYMNAAVAGTSQKTESTWYHNGMQNESLQIHLDDRDSEGIFRISYDYQIEKFTTGEVERMHTYIMNMLFDGIENPEKAFCELKMLPDSEKHKLCENFNNTEKIYNIPEGSTLYSLFEETVKRNPEKTCITVGSSSISYNEFRILSERIDNEVRKHTGNRKSVVAVIAERSVMMYGALYGIIRGGNAYLPVSPELPRDRIRYMLENSNVSCVLAQEQFLDLAGDSACINLSEVVQKTGNICNCLPCEAKENDTAYIIYTSGSTGRPKGVKISHESVINRILWMNEVYPLDGNDVILQKTPFTFDVSVWEIFWWGICGGSMAVSNPGEHFIPSKILETVHHNKVTHLHFVPSVLETFLLYLEKHKEEQNKFLTVKHVFVSGEVLDVSLVKRFYSLYDYSDVRLHNLYGPTECAVDVTSYDCLPGERTVPIGKPIYNTKIYITDKNLNLMPVGIKGELVIGGRNVGQGYIGDPVLTNERFVKNPFGPGMLYKTGDVAYWRDDGQLIFCGRMDEQIKLNGQRIEIGEIESVIKSVPGVESSVVIVRIVNGKKILTAYYCGKGYLEKEINDKCEKMLPGYMVPKLLIKTERIPINQNGKSDRKSLEKYLVELPQPNQFEVPINALEADICESFQNILGVESVGRNSDFFALGGTSLSMITFFAENDYELTPAEFIRNPTPAKLASELKKQRHGSTFCLETLYQPSNGKKAVVLFPFAGGNVESYAALTSSIKNTDSEISLYYVPFLHSDAECEKVAEEILHILDGCDVCFYSHCAGSAVALKILQILEEKQQNVIKLFITAAGVPFRFTGSKNIWNYVPDKILKNILKKAGLPEGILAGESVDKMLNQFRKDTDYASHVFFKKKKRIDSPVSVVLGRNDLFTKFYMYPEKMWSRYAKKIANVYYINTKNHYFHSKNSDKLAEMICSELKCDK